MARFEINRINEPLTYWEEFSAKAQSDDNLSEDALDEVHKNSKSIINLLETSNSVLVFGQVQSGKTLNYSGLISLILESKDLIIILAGTKTNLVEQTYERLNNYFLHSADIDVLKMSKGLRLDDELDKICRHDNGKLILISLKHQDYLSNIRKYLHGNAVDSLIIDDEADQASLNTKEYYSYRNDLSDMSRIYSEIKSILNSDSVQLVQYTATPQALFLLSTDSALSPEKYYVQYPPNSYFGIHQLLHSSQDHLVPIIDFDSCYKYVIDKYIKTCYTLVSSHNYDTNISCLIHSDWRKATLAENFQQIQSFLNAYQFDTDEWRLLENDTMPLNNFSDWFRHKSKVHDVFDTASHIEWEKNQFNILVGGNMLERGYTIPGLVTTLLTRNNKGASKSDTLQQRCRFLGYRGILQQYLKVYTTESIIDDLRDYDQSQTILLEEIGQSGLTADFSKSFLMKFLLPTRQNVLPASLKRCLRKNNLQIHRQVNNFDNLLPLFNFGPSMVSEPQKIHTNALIQLFLELKIPPFTQVEQEIPVFLFGTPNKPRTRSFKEDGKILELFQGRNNNYRGDRNIYGTNYHLQIHLIQDNNKPNKHIYFIFMNSSEHDIVELADVL